MHQRGYHALLQGKIPLHPYNRKPHTKEAQKVFHEGRERQSSVCSIERASNLCDKYLFFKVPGICAVYIVIVQNVKVNIYKQLLGKLDFLGGMLNSNRGLGFSF